MEEVNLISQADAARVLGVSRQAINKLVKSKKLSVSTIAGRDFVFKEEVEAFKLSKHKRSIDE